jgi:hypothetical protein
VQNYPPEARTQARRTLPGAALLTTLTHTPVCVLRIRRKLTQRMCSRCFPPQGAPNAMEPLWQANLASGAGAPSRGCH